ncbi:MAG: hypothetical protein FWD00_01555 [Clostridiales bacterium]|nr:hypothetical protein [Clostridiales bacterium]
MNFDFDEKRVIQKELLLGERVIWQGAPCRSKVVNKADIFLIPFSIFWAGFVLVWTITATLSAGSFGLVGIPFLIMGGYLTFGRFIVKNRMKRSTIYAITNMRILVARTNGKNFSSMDINAIPNASISHDKNGIGTIVFGTVPAWSTMYLNTGMDFFGGSGQPGVVAFIDIEDSQKVFDIYKRTKYQQHA